MKIRPSSLRDLLILFVLTSCAPLSTADLAVPDASVTGISLSMPQIDTSHRPDVRLFLSVSDQDGNFLNSFRLGNFSLIEEDVPGVPYEVGQVTDGLYAILVIDRSGSMSASAGSGTREDAAKTAATAFLQAMGTDDYAALIEFDDTVATYSGFTQDKDAVISAVTGSQLGGSTAIYDALDAAVTLASSVTGRKLILLLTDGEDNSSSLTKAEAIAKINIEGLAAYTVGLGDGFDTSVLTSIATETGGATLGSEDGTGVSDFFIDVLDRFNNLVYVKYRQHKSGTIKAYINFGSFGTSASKVFPDPNPIPSASSSP